VSGSKEAKLTGAQVRHRSGVVQPAPLAAASPSTTGAEASPASAGATSSTGAKGTFGELKARHASIQIIQVRQGLPGAVQAPAGVVPPPLFAAKPGQVVQVIVRAAKEPLLPHHRLAVRVLGGREKV